tara:strand:+ start:297 stop:599 length:303 start_codon:yes stop_codon:yes gene_type:complete
MTGYKGYSLMAIPLNAKGDITGADKIIWTKRRGTPCVPSPILYDGLLYFTQSNQALLSYVNAKSDKNLHRPQTSQGTQERLCIPRWGGRPNLSKRSQWGD